MRLLWEEQAWDDYCYWQTQDISGWGSRRIDDVNRLVYQERDGAIIIASCRGHYDD